VLFIRGKSIKKNIKYENISQGRKPNHGENVHRKTSTS